MGSKYSSESYTFCNTCEKTVSEHHNEQHIIIKISIQMANPPPIQNTNTPTNAEKIIGCMTLISGKCIILNMDYAPIRMCCI